MIKILDTPLVHPNPDQPRKKFDEESIKALGVSIKEQGQLQAITVVRHPDIEDAYMIVAGERR